MAVLSSKLVLELVDRVTEPARRVGETVKNLNNRVASNNRRIAEVRGQALNAAAGLATLGAALWKPISGAIAFESAMADVAKVVDFKDAAAFQTFQQSIRDLSEIPGMPAANDLAAIAAAAGQAGIAGDDLTRFTEVAAKVGTAFDIGAGEAGEALAKLMTGLNLTIPEVTSLSDAMNHLSNAQASSAAEILDVVRRVGAQAKQFGFSAEQVSAFASAMIASGAESEVAATSFANMGRALTRGTSATKRQNAALDKLGLNAVDVAKRMQEDAVGTTIDVMERIGKLPAEMRAAISSDFFGDEARALGPLLTNLDLVRESIGLVADDSQYAGSAFDEFMRRANTFGAKLEAFGHSLQNIGTVIGTTLFPVLTDLMNRIKPIIAAVSDWAAVHRQLVSNIIAGTAALAGFRLAIAGLRLAGLFAMGAYLKSVATGFAVLGISAGALGLVAAGVAGVAAAGYLLWQHWDRVEAVASGVARAIGEALQPALEKLRPILEPLAPVFDAIVSGLNQFSDAMHAVVGWIGNLFGSLGEREILTADQEKAAADRAYEIARKVIAGLTGLRGALVELGADAIRGLWDGMKGKFAELLGWLKGIPAQIKAALPSIDLAGWASGLAAKVREVLPGGGEDSPVPEQRHAAGGWFHPGGVTVGERGEERLYASQAGFIAHNRAVRQMAAMASRVSIPQPRALAMASGGPRGGGPVNVSFGDIIIQGGSGASASELRSAFGREATAALRSHFTDSF